MKKILLLSIFVLSAVAAFAQYPAAPNKIALGRQTTGNGLVYITDSIPFWTPTTANNAWAAIDTLAKRLYAWRNGQWESVVSAGGTTIDSLTYASDTLYLYTSDGLFSTEIISSGGGVQYSDSLTVFVTPTQLSDSLAAIPTPASIYTDSGTVAPIDDFLLRLRPDTTFSIANCVGCTGFEDFWNNSAPGSSFKGFYYSPNYWTGVGFGFYGADSSVANVVEVYDDMVYLQAERGKSADNNREAHVISISARENRTNSGINFNGYVSGNPTQYSYYFPASSPSTTLNDTTIMAWRGLGGTPAAAEPIGFIPLPSGGGGGMTSFTLAGDAGTPQTVGDGETATIAGGYGVNTSAGSTRTVTVTVDTAEVATVYALADSVSAVPTLYRANGTLSGDRTVELEDKFFWLKGEGGVNYYMDSTTLAAYKNSNSLSITATQTELAALNANSDLALLAEDTIKLTSDFLQINNFGTYYTSTPARENTHNQIFVRDSLTGQIKIMDKASIAGGGGATDLSFSGSASPVTLNSSTGTDVRFVAGTGVTLAQSGDTLTISATGGSSPSVITPALITANQNDYAPTGWAGATMVRISGDSLFRGITSFSASGLPSGHEKTIVNVGDYPIYFPGDHPDGTAANRIKLRKDYFLFPSNSCKIVYDGTSERWVVMGMGENLETEKTVTYQYSAASATSGDNPAVLFSAISSGSVNTESGAGVGFPTSIAISTLTTTNGGGSLAFPKNTTYHSKVGEAHIVFSAVLTLPALSDATDTYTTSIQVSNAAAGASTIISNNTISVQYTHSSNEGRWELFSRDGTTTSSGVDLGVTVAALRPYHIVITIDRALSEARVYIDGIYRGRVTSNLPVSGTSVLSKVLHLKSAGSTARLCRVHSMYTAAIYPNIN